MSTYQIEIEDLIGSVGDTAFITDALTNGARELMNLLPEDELELFSQTLTDTGSGIATSTLKVISANKSGYEAKKVPSSMSGRYEDSGSIYFATTKSPVFYMKNGKTYVVPSGGAVQVVKYPTIDYDDLPGAYTSTDAVPEDIEPLLVLYAAVKGRIRQLSDKRASIPSSITLPVEPAAPTIDTSVGTSLSGISYSAPASPTFPADISIPSLDADSGLDVPSYSKPIMTLSSIVEPDNLTINATAPTTVPAAPTFIYADASASEVGTETVGGLGTAPTFVSPVLSTDFGSVDTEINDDDVEIAEIKLNKIQAQVGEYGSKIQDAQIRFNKENTEYQALLQQSIEEARLSLQEENQEYVAELQRFQSEISVYQADVNKEVQEYTNQLQRYKIELDTVYQSWHKTESDNLTKYQSDIQNELHEFNKESTIYQSTVQSAVEDARIASQRVVTDAQLITDVSKQNKLQGMARQIQEYEASLNRFNADVKRYQTEVNTEVQTYTINEIQKQMALWQAKTANELKEYSQNVQNNLNDFNADYQTYRERIQMSINEFSTKHGMDVQNYKTQVDKELNRYQAEIQNAVNNYQDDVTKHSSELAEMARKNQDSIGKYQADIQDYSTKAQARISDYSSKVQRYAGEHGQMIVELQALQAEYRNGLQSLMSRYKGEEDGR